MKRTLSLTCVRFSLFFAICLTNFLLAAPARAEIVRCPVNEMIGNVTTPVPDGWWVAPLEFFLRETRVVTQSDGRAVLQCLYGPTGELRRYAPEGLDCIATLGGFDCTDSAAGSIVSTGAVELRQTYQIDFDSGRVGRTGADLWFQVETGEEMFLTPVGGAQIGLGNGANRGRDGCAQVRLSENRIPLRQLETGAYLCLRTGDDRIVQFRVNAISFGSSRMLEIGYTTWR